MTAETTVDEVIESIIKGKTFRRRGNIAIEAFEKPLFFSSQDPSPLCRIHARENSCPLKISIGIDFSAGFSDTELRLWIQLLWRP